MLSVKRGKLGDAVGYNVSNSNTKERQGWRIYQPVVKNPQTQGQLWQRIKLAAVNNQYRAIKEIIKRGFEGQEYGDPSRRAWLSMAMGNQFDGPWLLKGEMAAAPLRDIPLTVGSLPEITVTYDPDDLYLYTNIPCTDDVPTTIAELSELFFAAGYREGDQLTIVQCMMPQPRIFSWHTLAIYLSSSDTRTLASVGLQADYANPGSQTYLADLLISAPVGATTSGVLAVAYTISRDGDGSHLRSTARLGMRPTMDEYLYSEVAKINAGLSYVKSKSANEDWQQVPTRSAGGSTYVTKAADGTSVTLVSTSMNNGYVVVVSDTGEEYYVKCTDVKLTPYNAWLKAKSGTQAEMYTATAPVDPVPSDSYVPLNPTSNPTEENLALWYFLLSQGFDALSLMGRA